MFPWQKNLLDTLSKVRYSVAALVRNPCDEVALSGGGTCTLDEPINVMRYMRIGGELVPVGGWVSFKGELYD